MERSTLSNHPHEPELYPGDSPETIRPGFGRRTLLKAAAVSVSGAGLELLSACTSEDISRKEPLPDCGETPVHVETRPISPDGLDLTIGRWRLAGVDPRSDILRIAPAPVTIVDSNEQALKDKPAAARDIKVLPFDTARHFRSEDGLRFTGEIALNQPDTKASLLLAETLPLTYDEFQFLPGKGVRVTLSTGGGLLEVWSGKHKDSQKIPFAVTPGAGLTHSLTAKQENDQLLLTVNGQQIATPVDFSGKQVWIGLEAQDGSFDVKSLTVQPLEGKTAVTADMTSLQVAACKDGLRTLAERKNPECKIGTAVAASPLLTDSRYAALVAGNCNIITTENALKPQFVQPQEGIFRLEDMQPILEFAMRHNMDVHGHALLPNRSLPKWMRDLPPDRDRVRQVMIDHVTGVIRRLPNLTSIDVVNEALDGWEWRKDTIWYRAMGDKFIDIALAAAHTAARRASPNLVLVVNENSIDKDDKRDEARFQLLLQKLIDVKNRNIGIRLAMGFEGHVYKLDRDEMSPSHLKRRMAMLAKHGILARVSEMDVTTHVDGVETAEGLRTQAEQFGEVAKVCMEAPNCISFTMWGIGGKYVSTASVDRSNELKWDSNLVWDKNMKQRPAAYHALREALR